MKISRKNYEKYFIDYLDGFLDAAGQQEIVAFLEKNPDLKMDLQEVERMGRLRPVYVEFENKTSLKKNEVAHELENAEVLQLQLIAMIEGDLNTEKKVFLQNYLSHNTLALKEQKRFQQTVLKPDMSIVYPHKKALKKQSRIISLYQRIGAIAALLVLFLSVYNFYQDDNTISNQTYSDNARINTEPPKELQNIILPGTSKREEDQKKHYERSNAQRTSSIAMQNIEPIKAGKIQFKNKITAEVLKSKPASSAHLSIVSREINDRQNEQFLSFKGLLLKKIFGTAQPKANDNATNWALADAGVAHFNKLSKRKILLRKFENVKGENDKIQVRFGKLEFERILASK